MDWQLADAKNRFSELVTQALTAGPQRVHLHNDVVVVLSEAEYTNASTESGKVSKARSCMARI